MCIVVDDVHLASFGTEEQLRQVGKLFSKHRNLRVILSVFFLSCNQLMDTSISMDDLGNCRTTLNLVMALGPDCCCRKGDGKTTFDWCCCTKGRQQLQPRTWAKWKFGRENFCSKTLLFGGGTWQVHGLWGASMNSSCLCFFWKKCPLWMQLCVDVFFFSGCISRKWGA